MRRRPEKRAPGHAMNALWRRLDRPGHDAAYLRQQGDGWRLSGGAVYSSERGPASVAYAVDVDRGWAATKATVRGFIGDRAFEYEILRRPDAWRVNGVVAPASSELPDLDLSFTPATNALQLRRAAPSIGQTISLPAAWFDLDRATLSELPQTYERLAATIYRYAAPSVPYEGFLEVASDGFITTYPNLWRRETAVERLASM